MNFWNLCHCLTQFISLILILKSCILLPFSIANNTMLWWITWTCLPSCLWNTGIPVHLERADRQTWSKRHPERKHCSQFFWRIHPCNCSPRSRRPCCHESPSQPAHRAHRAHTSRKSLSRKKMYSAIYNLKKKHKNWNHYVRETSLASQTFNNFNSTKKRASRAEGVQLSVDF